MTAFPLTNALLAASENERYAGRLEEAKSGLHLVPPHLREGILAWAMDARPVGNFLTAVIENDLREAVARGDENSLTGLKGLVQFLYNYAPSPCWGSPAKVEAWRACGGVRGYRES